MTLGFTFVVITRRANQNAFAPYYITSSMSSPVLSYFL